MTRPELRRYTFWYDHFRYFVMSSPPHSRDPDWTSEDVPGEFVFPPQDGVIGWRPPGCVEIMPGHEAGELDVDLGWLPDEPTGVYDTLGVASACDIATPNGRVVLADTSGQLIAAHHFADVVRCRVFVEVFGRSWQVPWGTKSEEHHTVLVWPSETPRPWWRSTNRDEVAKHFLDEYRRAGIEPDVGQREP